MRQKTIKKWLPALRIFEDRCPRHHPELFFIVFRREKKVHFSQVRIALQHHHDFFQFERYGKRLPGWSYAPVRVETNLWSPNQVVVQKAWEISGVDKGK